ncbi:MAG: hypothetical protein WC290_02045 [archaeon]|jgi:hypothetical protein
MPVQRNLKRVKPNRKASLKKLNRNLAIGSVAALAAFGAIKTNKLISEKRVQKMELASAQEAAYRRGLEKRWVNRLNQLEKEQKTRVGLINDAIKRGMLPRFVRTKEGEMIMDYIDPPSKKGVKRAKPIKTEYGKKLDEDYARLMKFYKNQSKNKK